MLSTERSTAEKMDREDPLASLRHRFHIPKNKSGQEVIYLCGNSLGYFTRSSPTASQPWSLNTIRQNALNIEDSHRRKS